MRPVLAADIHFDAAEHRYTVAGVRWPSVTEVLDPLLELDGIPRAALKAAAEFGTHVHMATDLYDKGTLDEPALDPHLAPYLAAWKLFLRDTGSTVLASELRVGHSKLRYAGTLDKIIRTQSRGRNRGLVLDIKSGQVPRTVGPQAAAYLEAAESLALDDVYGFTGRAVLQLRGDATYRFNLLADPTDWSIFLSALNLHRWRTK
jgi:hypothetical protein